MNPRRLYRCRQDRMLAGVAGGMAEYLEVDPTVVRILWILSAFLGGFTILLYIILAFVIPLEPLAGPVPVTGPMPGTGAETGAETGAGTEAGTATADATQTAWASPAQTAWAAPAHTAWTAPAHHVRPDDRRGGRAGLVFGTLLVVFGAIALAGVLVPTWAASGLLGPAFVLALGIALLVGATRRPAAQP